MPRFRMVRTSAFAAHIVCLALFAGCKSSTGPSSSTYSATFSANGSTVQYTTQSSLLAAFAQASTQYDCIVSAFDASSSLSLQMYDGSAITAKAYSGYNVVGGALVGVLVVYQDAAGVVYRSGGVTTDALITVTQITSTTIRGTFQGTVKSAGHANVVIANGTFYVKRAN